MADHMDMSPASPLPYSDDTHKMTPQLIDTSFTSSTDVDQDHPMTEVTRLNEELRFAKQDLERERQNCHQLNHVLTTMVDYFMGDAPPESRTAVESSVADSPIKHDQPLLSFDDDNFSDYNNSFGSTGPPCGQGQAQGTLVDSPQADLISLCASEGSISWSSCATGWSSVPSEIGSDMYLCFPEDDKNVNDTTAGDEFNGVSQAIADSSLDGIQKQIMHLDIARPEGSEEGEIVETNSGINSNTLPPTFWKYIPETPHPRNFLEVGIRFDSGDPADASTFKSVLIQNLPCGIHTQRLLSRVRGGDVVACTVVPAGSLQGYDAAYVQFKTAAIAADYADFMRFHPQFLDGYQMIVEHLKTPTYPLSPMISDAVYRFGCTRCLRVSGARREIKITARWLNEVLLTHFRSPLVVDGIHDVGGGDDYTPRAIILRFASVEIAGRAWHLLKYSGEFFAEDMVDIEHIPDPCNVPMATLLANDRGRRMRPSGFRNERRRVVDYVDIDFDRGVDVVELDY